MRPLNILVVLAVIAPIYGSKLSAYGWGTENDLLTFGGALISLLGLIGLIDLTRCLRTETPPGWRVSVIFIYLYIQAALAITGAWIVLENVWEPVLTNVARGAFFSAIPLSIILGVGIWRYYFKQSDLRAT